MAHETTPLPYKEFVEHIDEYLDAIDRTGDEVKLCRGSRAYKLVPVEGVPDDDFWAGYDPERLRRTIAKHRYNALEGLDTEAFKQYLKETRSQDSQGRPA
jgi:hypothetical protein